MLFSLCLRKRIWRGAVLNDSPVGSEAARRKWMTARWAVRARAWPNRSETCQSRGMARPQARNPGSAAKKSKPIGLDFFICAVRHNIIWPKVNIISSEARTSWFIFGTNERGWGFASNDVATSCKWCYACGVNDVALRANGAVAVRFNCWSIVDF